MHASAFTADDVLALLDVYAGAWRSNDTGQIAEHWAPDAFLFYKAEEVRRFFTRWEDVLAYWRQNERLHERVELRFSEAGVSGLSDHAQVAHVRMRWDIRFARNARNADGSPFAHRGEAMGGDNHVVVFLHGRPETWKLSGWVETPDAALTYMRSLYLAAADPDRV